MARRRGFTLIELLVVIAVLGVLMAILLPSLRTAKRQARRTVCGTNLRQLGVAMQGYVGDNQDRYPRVSFMPSMVSVGGDEPVYIADVLAPYVSGNEKVFECPDDLPGRVDRPAPNIGLSYFQSERSSYEYRRWGLSGRTIEEVANRAERRHWVSGPVADNAIWIMRDFHNFHRSGKRIATDDQDASEEDDAAGSAGQRNYLFSDGHVSDYETM